MKTKTICLLGGLLASCVGWCPGQTFDARYLGIDPVLVESASFDGGTNFHSYQAGEFQFDFGPAFCVEPSQTILTGEVIVYTVQNPSTLNEFATISRIVGGYYFASARTAIDAAAAQWAIWEVVVDGSTAPSFATGSLRFRAPSSAVGLRAMDYLNNLDKLPVAPLSHLTNPARQDMVTPIPEPAALLLGSLGPALLLFRRR